MARPMLTGVIRSRGLSSLNPEFKKLIKLKKVAEWKSSVKFLHHLEILEIGGEQSVQLFPEVRRRSMTSIIHEMGELKLRFLIQK